MISRIVLWPDPRLRLKSLEVSDFEEAKRLVQDLRDTMNAAGGVGISAVQIGVPRRILLVRSNLYPEGGEVIPTTKAWINPKIVSRSKATRVMSEGCLSLPGITERVKRHTVITVEGQDLTGARMMKTLEGDQGSECHIFQHEYDHLQGITIPDRLDRGAKDRIRAEMRKRRGM